MSEDPLHVSCPCGRVEVEIAGPPVAQFHCHCSDCRTAHGGASVARWMLRATQVRHLRGETQSWTIRRAERVRCAHCGVAIFADVPEFGIRGLNADLLPPGTFVPQFHIHCREAIAPVPDGLPHYRALPPAFGGTDDTVEW